MNDKMGNFFIIFCAFLFAYIILQMCAQLRGQPQLLSIEAVVQKSQFKSKILNSIPLDIKKLFMEQMSKPPTPKQMSRGNGLIYEPGPSTIDYGQIKSRDRNRSGRLAKVLELEAAQTARNKLNAIEKRARKSLVQMAHKSTQDPHDPHDQNCNISNNQIQELLQVRKRVITANHIQFGGQEGERKQLGLRKIQSLKDKVNLHAKKNANEEVQKQDVTEQNVSKNIVQQNSKIKNQTVRTSFYSKKRSQTQNWAVPDFLVATISQQTQKISPIKQHKMEANEFFQESQFKEIKVREPKVPSCVLNLKKKVNFYRAKRSQQSCAYEQGLEPQVNFMKLIQKQKIPTIIRKQSEIIARNRINSRERIPVFQKTRRNRKESAVEQQVKGWDYVDGPNFQINNIDYH